MSDIRTSASVSAMLDESQVEAQYKQYLQMKEQRAADRMAFALADDSEKASIRKRARHRQCSINGLKAIEARLRLWFHLYYIQWSGLT